MARYIDLEVTEEYIKGSGAFVGAAQSHDDVVFKIKFGGMWNGTTKTVQFLDARHTLPATEIVLTTSDLYNNTPGTYLVPIPYEAKRYAGKMAMTIKGVIVNSTTQTETSAILAVSGEFVVKESNWDSQGQSAQDVTPTQAEQLQQELDSILGSITTAINAAASAAVSETNASSSANVASIAKNLAIVAKEAAEAAQAIASSAATTATTESTKIQNMTVSATALESNQNPTVTKQSVGSSYNLQFGLPKASNAITLTSGQWAAFQVINGHLYVTYPDDEGDVSFTINENGHLIMTVQGV